MWKDDEFQIYFVVPPVFKYIFSVLFSHIWSITPAILELETMILGIERET